MSDYSTLLRDHVTLKCRSLDRINPIEGELQVEPGTGSPVRIVLP